MCSPLTFFVPAFLATVVLVEAFLVEAFLVGVFFALATGFLAAAAGFLPCAYKQVSPPHAAVVMPMDRLPRVPRTVHPTAVVTMAHSREAVAVFRLNQAASLDCLLQAQVDARCRGCVANTT